MAANAKEERWNKMTAGLVSARESLTSVLAPGIISDIDVTEAIRISGLALPGYSTVDDVLIEEIRGKTGAISNYLRNPAAHRPLSFILTAEPGSGKSFFMKCISKDCGAPMVTANVASLQNISELGFLIDEIRDYKTQDETPLLMIDEADSKPADISAFLPLLWDGFFAMQGRSLKVGRCIIVLVVSNESLRMYIEDGVQTPDLKTAFSKIEDLLSRINGGVIRLGSLSDRRLDKLCIALTLIRRRFPAVKGVELPLLKLLVDTRFLHSVRSMETLIQYFPEADANGDLRVTPDFDRELTDNFLKKETFRSNVFAFHLSKGDRGHALNTWSDYKNLRFLVKF
jgi:KAP family P-loop domain